MQSSIKKIRYTFHDWSVVWEIDRYVCLEKPSSPSLLVAEVELTSQGQEILFPNWLRPVIVKEVTDDLRYYDKNIAVHGIPDPQ